MHFHPTRTALAAAALLTLCAGPAQAQMDAVEGLFEEVNAVTIFLQRGELADPGEIEGDDLRGAGVELLIDLVSGGWADLELGLGASYLRGYGSGDPDPLDLHTSVRALPTISLYASRDIFSLPRLGFLSGYGGLSFGLVDLWNAQAYDLAGKAWDLEAQTFEFGGSVGAYWTTSLGIGAFVETGLRQREFPSVKWTTPDGDSVPASWRSLDLSGQYVQFGLQLRVKEEDQNETITPPAPAGVWSLVRMDGADLPGTRDSTEVWTQVLHGVLRLEPSTARGAPEGSGRWTLDLNLRDRRENGGRVETTLRADSLAGTYTTAGTGATRKHVLTLTATQGGSGTFQAERLAGRLYVSWENHVLVFAPGTAAEAEDDDS